jgi:hypothetical protein
MGMDLGRNVPWYDYECDYCGRYRISRTAQSVCENDETKRHKVACVLAERRLKKMDKCHIHTQQFENDDQSGIPIITLDSLIDSYPQSPLELMDRSLLNLSRMIEHPGDLVSFDPGHPTVLFSQTKANLTYVLGQFRKAKFIAAQDHETTGGNAPSTEDIARRGFLIQTEGWRRISELRSDPAGDHSQAFVAMWFNESMEDIYDKGIFPAIDADCGVKCVRIDNVEHNNKICDEIIAEIRKSSFVVADFTARRCEHCDTCKQKEDCKDQVRPRGGVYFEAGFAKGLGIPVIWTVREDQIDDVHFDTQQYNHILYTNAKDLRGKLANRIKATIPLVG